MGDREQSGWETHTLFTNTKLSLDYTYHASKDAIYG